MEIPVRPLKRVTLVFGFDERGRGAAVQHFANELKQIMLVGIPGKTVIVQTKKSPEDKEPLTIEYPVERFYSVEYTPLEIQTSPEPVAVPEVPQQ